MGENEFECLECSRRYQGLLTVCRQLKRKNRKMRRAFARIEGMILLRPERYVEAIVGECEAFRGRYQPGY